MPQPLYRAFSMWSILFFVLTASVAKSKDSSSIAALIYERAFNYYEGATPINTLTLSQIGFDEVYLLKRKCVTKETKKNPSGDFYYNFFTSNDTGTHQISIVNDPIDPYLKLQSDYLHNPWDVVVRYEIPKPHETAWRKIEVIKKGYFFKEFIKFGTLSDSVPWIEKSENVVHSSVDPIEGTGKYLSHSSFCWYSATTH